MPLVKEKNLKSVKALVYLKESTENIYVEKNKQKKKRNLTEGCLLGIIFVHAKYDFLFLRCLRALLHVTRETTCWIFFSAHIF